MDIVGMLTQGYDRAERLRKIALSARPYVMLTMSPHSLQVIPVYGLQQYHVMGGQPSVLEGRRFAFLGTGNETIQNCLHLVPDATLANIGAPKSMRMATEAALDQWF